MKRLLWIILSLTVTVAKAQTYSPNNAQPANLPYGPSGFFPADARSYFYDPNLFLFRPYQSQAEALTYLQPSQIRGGDFPIFICTGTLLSSGKFSGGQTFVYFFRNGQADSNLVQWNVDVGASGNFLQVSNNLSDVANVATARTNLGLGAMAQQNLTAASPDVNGQWPNGLQVLGVQGHSFAYLNNYLNLQNRPTIPAQFNPIAGSNISLSGTYPNITFNASAGVETAGFGINVSLLAGSVVAIDSFNYRKVDTLIGVNDSTLNFTVNGKTYSITLRGGTHGGGGGGSGTVTNFSFTNGAGITGTVSNPTSTPALSLTLGNITPTTVNGLTFNSLTNGFSIQGGTTPATLTVPASGSVQGNNSGDVTISGGLTYLTLSGQNIMPGAIPLGTSVSGTLLATNFGALTGDVTNSAGSYATTISANAVTYAKFQQVASSSLVGNPTGSTANAQAIGIGYGLTFSAAASPLRVDSNAINLRIRQISDSLLISSGGGLTIGTLNSQTPSANGAVIASSQLVLQTVGTQPGLMTALQKLQYDSVYNGLKFDSIGVTNAGSGLWGGYATSGNLFFKTHKGINGISLSTLTDSTLQYATDSNYLNSFTRRIVDSAISTVGGGGSIASTYSVEFPYGGRHGSGPTKGGDSTYTNTNLQHQKVQVQFQITNGVILNVPDSLSWAKTGASGFSPYFKNDSAHGVLTFGNINNISSLQNNGFMVYVFAGSGFPAILDTGSAVPTINAIPTSLTGFLTSTGIRSASQTYSVSGSNLTTPISIGATGSFQVSTDNSTWSYVLTIPETGGSVPSTTIYVSQDTTVANTYNSNISNKSTGATTVLVDAQGSVTAPTSASFNFSSTAAPVTGYTNFFGSGTSSLSFTDAATGWTLVNIPGNWSTFAGQTGANNTGATTGSNNGTFSQSVLNNNMFSGNAELIDTTSGSAPLIGPILRFTNLPAGTFDLTLIGSIPNSFFNSGSTTMLFGIEAPTGGTFNWSRSFNLNGPSATMNTMESGPNTLFVKSGTFTVTITSGQTIDIYMGSGVIGSGAGAVASAICGLKITKH